MCPAAIFLCVERLRRDLHCGGAVYLLEQAHQCALLRVAERRRKRGVRLVEYRSIGLHYLPADVGQAQLIGAAVDPGTLASDPALLHHATDHVGQSRPVDAAEGDDRHLRWLLAILAVEVDRVEYGELPICELFGTASREVPRTDLHRFLQLDEQALADFHIYFLSFPFAANAKEQAATFCTIYTNARQT